MATKISGMTAADLPLTGNEELELSIPGSPRETRKATAQAIADLVTVPVDAMVFKGVIDASTNPNYPAADAGDVYKISVAGKVGGASGTVVEAGDTIYCITDATAAGTQAAVGANWVVAQVNVDGAVIGPASAVNGNLAVFSGTTGKLIADGGAASTLSVASAAALTTARNINGVAFDGSADVTVPATLALTGDVTGSGTDTFATTLAAVGTAGTYKSVTTDAKGRVTAGTNPTTLAGYGITDAATEAYVDASVAGLVDSSPATLNTLNELAAALGDDPSFATTVATSLGTKEVAANKNASGGYAGLTLFKLNLRNAANTITSWFTTAATVARTWTMPDKDGTVAMTSDITGTNSGVNTGDQSSISGNAATATALATSRTINGVAFDGTTAITVPAAAGTLTGATLAAGVTASSLTSVGTLGNLTMGGVVALSVDSAAALGSITKRWSIVYSGALSDGADQLIGSAGTQVRIGASASWQSAAIYANNSPVLLVTAGGASVTGTLGGVTDLTTTGNTILGNASTDTLNVGNGGIIKDASGNVGVGGTSGGSAVEVFTGSRTGNGFNIRFNAANSPMGFGVASANGFCYLGNNTKQVSGTDSQTYDISTFATRLRTDSGQFVFDGTSSGTAGNAITWVERMRIDTSGHITPGADNTQNTGSGALRWATVYAGTGTINTSDAREKTAVTPLTKTEVEASKRIAREIGSYRWLEAVTKKGDDARLHIGMTVQRAMEIMSDLGLDATRYAFICYDEWDGGDRYSFRHDELLLFLARGFDARLAALEG